MDDNAAREDACREYQSSLEDLTFNSKPHINMLTILAEENLNFAKDIVAIIEAQISKAPAAEKLPVLYLVDSIVKNVGGEYLAVFAKNLITSFICVFEKVDENTRKSLFKLRSTWDEVFPLKKLYALDVRVNSVDPAWPIKPLPPTVNASIHVNPKFLKQSEEPASPRPAPVPPAAPTPPAAPATPAPAAPAVGTQASVTQEQLIRQQLLAKQKQLLELQQKKIELELEQTKAQLAGGFALLTPTTASMPTTPSSAPIPASTTAPASTPTPASTPAQAPAPIAAPKPSSQPQPVVRPWIPPQNDTKTSTRDPRLNRTGPPAAPQPKEQPAEKKDSLPTTGSAIQTPEKKLPEKPLRPDKTRTQKKEGLEEKSKSPSPMQKSIPSKNKHGEAESQKSVDSTKKDPRLRKRTHDRGGEAKDEEMKDKKKCSDKRDREEVVRGADPLRPKAKLLNGSVTKHDRSESVEKPDFKVGGNARTHARKRTRSRSRSRSPNSSPKRKERRSPKSRPRSNSLSPSPSHKQGKPRRVRADETPHVKPNREDRPQGPKKNQSERRSKRPADDRRSESRDSHSPRTHDSSGKDAKEAPHRWRSGWEENKHLKPIDSHTKPGPLRHKSYSTPNRPSTPRTSKHRLSVDANLQIPDVLNTASKKDLLRRASKRLESGEISQEDFLNMAHQIKHFFQYQEEKQQRSDSWEDPADFAAKKQSLLAPPHENMDEAELTYYEHKSKLRKTQVTHRPSGEPWDGQENQEESEEIRQDEKAPAGHQQSNKYTRPPRERPGERKSKEREDARPQHGPMIEEYNHGKVFPTLKSLPGLRFRRRADPREPSEREWNSPLTERQRYDREEQKSGYDAPRRYGPHPESRHPDPRRPEGHPPSGGAVHRNCPSPTNLDPSAPMLERERLSPVHQKDSADMSPIPRFESPNSEHSDDGPLKLDNPLLPKSILKAAVRGGPLAGVRQRDSPGHTPPHDGGHPPSRFEGPGHVGPSRQHHPGWYEGGSHGRYDDPSRFEGPTRFDGVPPHHAMAERFEGPMRGGDGMGRFEGPHHPPGPGRFDGPSRFDGQGPFEGPIQCFNNMASGPMAFQKQRPLPFETNPNQMAQMRLDGPGPMRFENVQPGPRFDVPHQGGPHRYDCPPGQQGPPRFATQHNLQPGMRPIATPLYDNNLPPQQSFNMAPQRFPEPANAPFHGGPLPFAAQPNLPAATFNLQPAFNQPATTPFYNPAAPVNMQQPVNMMNLNQPFLPQNPVPFRSQTPQVVPAENHFGQVDVEDLLSKLISNGIIKPTQPDATQPTDTEPCTVPAAPPAEEEEEEEQDVEEEDFPDLTGFKIDDMKQRYESVVTRLYSGNQCCLCSMRFTAAQTDMYADHLDWHFRQNHAGKVASKKVTHRRWYYSLRDWIEFEEIADLEERAKSQFFEKVNEEEVQKNQAAAKEKEFQSVKATKDQVGESCEICQEPFETYWVEEEEDWFLKNAIRVDDKNFHPSCFEDYKNTSSYIDTTPSPNKLLTEHPLSAFVKAEEEEEKEPSCAADTSVKEEPEGEAEELKVVKKEEEELLTDVQSDEKRL